MKTKFWSVYVALISTSILAQEVSNPPPAAPIEAPAAAPAAAGAQAAPELQAQPAKTVSPAPKPAKKKAATKKTAKAPVLKTVPLLPGPAVVSANHVNVRGQAGLKGEILTRMTNGEPVVVVEEITLKHSGLEEPSAWAKIVMPTGAHTWVKASYIDPGTKTVIPRTLNMRGGPGENYSVLGTLHRGDTVKEIITKGDWMQIDAMTNAYAFMAAQYLTQEPAALAGVAPAETATGPATTVAEAPAAAEAVTNAPALAIAEAGTNQMAVAATTEAVTSATTNEVASAEPPPPRIVLREGIVRGATSIQAPTGFELIGADNRKLINYLYTTSPHLDLSRYKGLHIIVTGEEGLDDRWAHTPIITIQRIQVVD